MKKLLVALLFVLLPTFMYSQSWGPVGSGLVYGYCIYSFEIYNNELYVSSSHNMAGNNVAKYIAKWDGVSWSSVGNGLSLGPIYLKTYNNELYAIGAGAKQTGSDKGFAKWNGSSWESLNLLYPGSTDIFMNFYNYKVMEVFESNLIMGGWYSYARLCKWDGNTLTFFGKGTGVLEDTYTSALRVYNGNLYAGGTFTDGINSYSGIFKWDGNQWANITGTCAGLMSIDAMEVYNNDLYVTGSFTTIGGVQVSGIARWDGENWFNVNTSYGSCELSKKSICVMDNKLFVGGRGSYVFNEGGQYYSDVLQFNGSNWSRVSTTTFYDLLACPIIGYNHELYAGAGANYTYGSANIIKVAPISSGLNDVSNVPKLEIYPNPVNNILNIRAETLSPTSQIKVYNSIGEILINRPYTEQLDLGLFSSGMYLIQVFNSHNQIIARNMFIKE